MSGFGFCALEQVGALRLKLFKIGAIVCLSVRRIMLQMSSADPLERYLRAELPCPALLTRSAEISELNFHPRRAFGLA